MICMTCGKELLLDDAACPYCGSTQHLDTANSAAQAPPQQDTDSQADGQREIAQDAPDRAFWSAVDDGQFESPGQESEAPAPALCAACGAPLLPGDEQCRNCGQPIGAQSADAAKPTWKDRYRKMPPNSRRLLTAAVAVAAAVALFFGGMAIFRAARYARAGNLAAEGSYSEALVLYTKLEAYRDAPEKVELCQNFIEYETAIALMDNREFAQARTIFLRLGAFQDCSAKAVVCERAIHYYSGLELMEQGQWQQALDEMLAAQTYNDAADQANECNYSIAAAHMQDEHYYKAYEIYKSLGAYKDSATLMDSCIQPLPDSGSVYRNPDISRGGVQITFRGDEFNRYYKIYREDGTLIMTFFGRANERCTVYVPSGRYILKCGFGGVWYGEKDAFGDLGFYSQLFFIQLLL